MGGWFTVEQIDGDTFAISEYKHWEETHCYLLCGKDRAVLIDTGLGVSDIKKIVNSLTKLPITVLTTHVHWDHIGGHKYFNDIAVHEAEQDWLSDSFPLPLKAVKNNLTKIPCDFPSDLTLTPIKSFKARRKKSCATASFWIWAGGRFKSFTRRGILPDIAVFTSRNGSICIREI